MSEDKETNSNKKSLGEYASWMETIGYTDPLEIMRRFLIENELELEAVSMIATLAKTSAEKDRAFLKSAREWISILPDIYKSNDNVDYLTARKLTQMEQEYILKNEVPKHFVEWARELFPQMDTPVGTYMPMVEFLERNHRIYFRDRGVL